MERGGGGRSGAMVRWSGGGWRRRQGRWLWRQRWLGGRRQRRWGARSTPSRFIVAAPRDQPRAAPCPCSASSVERSAEPAHGRRPWLPNATPRRRPRRRAACTAIDCGTPCCASRRVVRQHAKLCPQLSVQLLCLLFALFSPSFADLCSSSFRFHRVI